jgi:hypothetical protein
MALSSASPLRRYAACLVMLAAIPVLARAQVNSPATALERAGYQVFSGHFNGDSYIDILVRAKPKIVPIAIDDLAVPIAIFASPTFALLSDGAGSYSLVVRPSASITSSSVWQANTHSVAYADFLGNGVTGIMIRSVVAGGVSFTVTSSPSAVQPSLLQKISSSDLGLDLGASGRTVEFRDANRDGRSDLVVRTNGLITDTFLADSNGLFVRATGNSSIEAAWYGLRASLDANDRASALNFISSDKQSQYSALFQAIGSELPNLTQRWSSIAGASVDSRFANYIVTQTINGTATDYMITFVFENDRWVISEL